MSRRNKTLVMVLAVVTFVLWGTVLFFWVQSQKLGDGRITVVAVPDRTESTQNPLFIKETYEPVVLDGTNIALDAKITANGFQDVYTPAKAADGRTEGISYWEGENDAYPNILTATFKEEHRIHAIKVCLCPQSVWSVRMQTFRVEVSEDGENFTELLPDEAYEFNPDTANEVVLEFDEVTCEAMQLVFTGNTGAGGAQVAEFEIYSRE